jgi:hypothetical protein
MSLTIDKKAALVSELISSCYAAKNGYRSAAHAVEDNALRRLLEIYAQQRTRFAQELSEYLPVEARFQQDDFSELSLASGATQRDSIAECLKMDSKTLALYKEAVAQRSLPSRAHFLISSQLALMERVHDRMNLLLANPLSAKTSATARRVEPRLHRASA